MAGIPDDPDALRRLLPPWAAVSSERAAHIGRVARLADQWADAMRVPELERRRWLRAVFLHDALRDADPAELVRWAPGEQWPLAIRHGPASAARAEAEGETDRGVLDAVRYHSVGYEGWDAAGRILYCADFLEPGRAFRRQERAALAARLPADSESVLREVVRARIQRAVAKGWPLPGETIRLWNSLARFSSDASD